MKKLILMAFLAMQLTVASAAQTRFSDELLEARDSPAWSCFLTVAGDEQIPKKEGDAEQQTEEEPDCE